MSLLFISFVYPSLTQRFVSLILSNAFLLFADCQNQLDFDRDFVLFRMMLPQSHGCTYSVRWVAHGAPRHGSTQSTPCWPTWTSFVPSRVFRQWSEREPIFRSFRQSKIQKRNNVIATSCPTTTTTTFQERKIEIINPPLPSKRNNGSMQMPRCQNIHFAVQFANRNLENRPNQTKIK